MDFDTIPKIENHLHLEGAIPLDALWQLIQKYGGDSSVLNFTQLQEKFTFRDFNHFLELWSWKNKFIREYEDFSFLTTAVLDDLTGQHIRYAEIFISPSLFAPKLNIQRIVEAITTSINKKSGIRVNLIVDLVRNFGPEREMRTLHQISEVKNLGIIGIGIGGNEKAYPPILFKDVYETTRKFGLRTTTHAGEAAGPQSVWDAILVLKTERIGHGTRAIEDSRLMQYLADHQIPVELCLSSNVKNKGDTIH